MATVLNLIARIKWRILKVDFAMLDPKNSFETAKLSKISFDKKTGKNNKVPLKMCSDYIDFIGSIISNNSKAFSYLSFRFFEREKLSIWDLMLSAKADLMKWTTSGKDIHIFLDVRMKKDNTIEEAHEIINTISKKIKYKHPNIKSLFVHIEPMYEDN